MGNIRNQVRLIGNLGRDPEFREISSGRKMARFSLATNDYYYSDQGEKIAETQWHQLVAWGKLAEVSERLLHKGSELVVDGKLNTRSYTDKEGNRRSYTEVVVLEMALMDRKAPSGETPRDSEEFEESEEQASF
ncbi:MAG: single-stranded DNA-binding protein [Cytophagia bacterium]|jgi:single-strand DNA-binding protein|nr:single-stranded DNA-binding protein [Cytophagia bacterium]